MYTFSELRDLLNKLQTMPAETEIVEFKKAEENAPAATVAETKAQ